MNDEFRGTKGKWEVIKLGSQNEAYYDFSVKHTCQCCNDVRIETVGKMWINHGWNVQSDSDALLISKAPEMLEMLKTLVKEFDVEFTNQYQFDLHSRAKQLIKEATDVK